MDTRIKIPRISSNAKSSSTLEEQSSQDLTDVEYVNCNSSDSASLYMSDVESVFSDESEDAEWERIQREELRPGRRVPACMTAPITTIDDQLEEMDFSSYFSNGEERQEPSHNQLPSSSDAHMNLSSNLHSTNNHQIPLMQTNTHTARVKSRHLLSSSTASGHQHSDSSDED